MPESSPTQEIANMIVANLTNRSKTSKDLNFLQDYDDAGGSNKSLDDSQRVLLDRRQSKTESITRPSSPLKRTKLKTFIGAPNLQGLTQSGAAGQSGK